MDIIYISYNIYCVFIYGPHIINIKFVRTSNEDFSLGSLTHNVRRSDHEKSRLGTS